jgi:hypothetical protein
MAGSFRDYTRNQAHKQQRQHDRQHHGSGALQRLIDARMGQMNRNRHEHDQRNRTSGGRNNPGHSSANASGGTFTHGDIAAGTHLNVDVSGGRAVDRGGGGGGADHHERTHGEQKAANHAARAASRKPPGEFITYASQASPRSAPAPRVNVAGLRSAQNEWRDAVSQILQERNAHLDNALAQHAQTMAEYKAGIADAAAGMRSAALGGIGGPGRVSPRGMRFGVAGGDWQSDLSGDPGLVAWLQGTSAPTPNPGVQGFDNRAYAVGPNGAPYRREPMTMQSGEGTITDYSGNRPEARFQQWFTRHNPY